MKAFQASKSIFVPLLALGLAACGQSSPLPASPEKALLVPATGTPSLLGRTLEVAEPQVIALAADPDDAERPLSASLAAWRGARAGLAGTAHYDRGEWIYEDYPWTAYGAALVGTPLLYGALDLLGGLTEPAERLPGSLAVAIPQAGAGSLVEEADLSELRLAVRGAQLHVMARTTTMRAPVRTALLLLFDTGRAGPSRAVPFGSRLKTRGADTAVLVTAGGARIVDLVGGGTTDLPSASDPTDYVNLIATRLPLARVSRAGGSELRLVAATGLADTGGYTLAGGGLAGPIAKVVPRFDEPVQSTYDRLQAVALAARTIDRFFVTVSVDRLRAGDSERLLPGPGYSVRTYLVPEARSSEGGTNGSLRQYGLYLPQGVPESPAPATLLLRGSSMSAHGLAAITPGLFQNLGDDNGAVIISPCGRSGFDLFQGPTYLDVMQAIDDARALLPLDPDRFSVAGYSMGGYATYMFASTQPDMFSGAFAIAGPVGGLQPATSLYGFPNVIPMLSNLIHTPVEIFQGDVDVNVPITNALAAVQRLHSLGYRYKFNLLLANTHFSMGIMNDYSIGARYLRATRRVAEPARVVFSRSMSYERAVDTASFTDLPGERVSMGLRFDDAWFVQDLEAVDPVEGTASADVRTLARSASVVTPLLNAGLDTGPLLGQAASPFKEQTWQLDPVDEAPRNAFDASFAGVSSVHLDLAGMALSAAQPLSARIRTDADTRVTLILGQGACLGLPANLPGGFRPGALELSLPPGEHEVELSPCGP
jgi:pimeloyl-ACP methyl ester carboxylesterase